MAEDKNLTPEEEVEVELIDLTDDAGNTQTYQVLDIVEYNGNNYLVMIEDTDDENANVEVCRIIVNEEDNTETYVTVDEEEGDPVYELFKEKNKDLYDFED